VGKHTIKQANTSFFLYFFLFFFLYFSRTYLLLYLSFPLRIDPLRFQTGCRKRRLNLTLVFSCLFRVVVHLFWLVNACVCCVRFNIFPIPSRETGFGKRLRNDLGRVEWDVKPNQNSINQSITPFRFLVRPVTSRNATQRDALRVVATYAACNSVTSRSHQCNYCHLVRGAPVVPRCHAHYVPAPPSMTLFNALHCVTVVACIGNEFPSAWKKCVRVTTNEK